MKSYAINFGKIKVQLLSQFDDVIDIDKIELILVICYLNFNKIRYKSRN